MTAGAASVRAGILDRLPRGNRAIAWAGILLGLLAFFVALPPVDRALARLADPVRAARDLGRALGRDPWCGSARVGRTRPRRPRDRARLPRNALRRGEARQRGRVVGALRRDAPLRDAAHVRGDRRHLQRALRRREHRPRGDDADGRVLRDPRCGQARLVAAGAARSAGRRRADGADPRVRLDPSARRSDRERHGDQLPRARRHRLLLHRRLRRPGDARRAGSLASRRSTSTSSARFRASGRSSRTCSATST